MITCPHCKKTIEDDDALLCLYCGESLERPIGVFGKIKYPTPRVIAISGVALILLAFAALMIFSP